MIRKADQKLAPAALASQGMASSKRTHFFVPGARRLTYDGLCSAGLFANSDQRGKHAIGRKAQVVGNKAESCKNSDA